jgi:2-polyprenyl-3-methyl-5-hydroxy-6-metoxy-1,4-benzoquinol methylase
MIVNKIKMLMERRRIPLRISRNFKDIDNEKMDILKCVLKSEYFKNLSDSFGLTEEKYLATDEGKVDLENHTTRRLTSFRKTVVPWLDSMRRLPSMKILEIGCGTGCSTVALAEQGAEVTGIDIDIPSLNVAKQRIKLYGSAAHVMLANATEIDKFDKKAFDSIIFFAVLEHMSIDERIISLKKAWGLLPEKGILVVIETPNRLWYFDDHTSMLPFFHWLPDQLALYYSSKSPRKNFYCFPAETNSVIPAEFCRLGRGVSYHEFELAFERPAKQLHVIGDMRSYFIKKEINPLALVRWKNSTQNRYSEMLNRQHPDLNTAFFMPYLNLAILKKD